MMVSRFPSCILFFMISENNGMTEHDTLIHLDAVSNVSLFACGGISYTFDENLFLEVEKKIPQNNKGVNR